MEFTSECSMDKFRTRRCLNFGEKYVPEEDEGAVSGTFDLFSRFHRLVPGLQRPNLEGSFETTRVMMSGDSPPPLQSSIPPGFDMPDEMRHGKITPTETPLIPMKPRKNNGEIPNEDIEEAVPIVKTLPMPEPQPKVERNGGFDYDHTDGKQLVNDVEDDACFVKCIYFTQQCCECTVL
ncbi:uncharacterized protein LOC117177237 isoform X1 [Belonocnema kinseyi]|uniref:uncharacterized protein LOC117177237 isoform X1 n=1 Tax=Belonocnema kinseyi TaxID=2817044 RepID=UPI00143E0695|nr:uncharacterized protein LOC117177237 isoform X1 [Belonocnema kinseyi]